MEGVVSEGDIGAGIFAEEVLKWDTVTVPGVIEVVAFYHFTSSKHSFSALVHVVQTGLQGVIAGVVTDGWLKGRAVKGEYTPISIGPNPYGGTLPYFVVTLDIERDSKD